MIEKRVGKKGVDIFFLVCLLCGVLTLVLALHPRTLVEWLARQYPEILFSNPTSIKMVALTIDDGPQAETTSQILDVLEVNNAKATFFLIGDNVRGNELLVKRIVADGHEIGNHMWLDEASVSLDPGEFEEKLLRTKRLLDAFQPTMWFRPGSGRFNDDMLEIVSDNGYRTVLASVYPYDVEIPSVVFAIDFLLSNIQPGDIVILHDGHERGIRTNDILSQVLPALNKRGFKVVTVSQLQEQG